MKKYLVLPLLLLAAALALTACGGGSSGGGEEAAVEEAIEESATSTDPSKCTELQTALFNETETEEKGAEATKTCEEEVEKEENVTESVSVSEVKVNGETATAAVEIEGSALNEQAVELEVLNEGGSWKLNKFLGFTKYDAANIATFLEGKLNEEEGVEPALAKCVAEGVEGMSEGEAEAMIFEKKQEGLEEIATACNE